MGNNQIFLALIGVFGGLMSMIVKSYIDRRATKKDITARDKNISDRLAGIENLFTQFDMKLGQLICDNDFRNDFKNALRVKMNALIKAGAVDGTHRNILSYVEQWVEEFGLRFYYTSYRKNDINNKRDLDQYLTCEYQIRRDQMHELIMEKFPYSKLSGKDKLFFLDLLKKTKINAASETLIYTLVRNGLTEKEVIGHFENYLETFYFAYIATCQLWSTLKTTDENDI